MYIVQTHSSLLPTLLRLAISCPPKFKFFLLLITINDFQIPQGMRNVPVVNFQIRVTLPTSKFINSFDRHGTQKYLLSSLLNLGVLTICGSFAGNHTCCDFLCTTAMSCPQISIL